MIALSEWRESSVAEQAEQLLYARDSRFSRCVTCSSCDGTLVLRGRVPTYYLKQLAQTIVVEIDDAEQIDNRIEVFDQPHRQRQHLLLDSSEG
jgi:hypothetical protein